MTVSETFVELVTAPWVLASSLIAAIGQFTGLWPVVDFAVSQASLWFGPLAIFSWTLAPRLEWVPDDLVMGVFVGAAGVVFLRRANSAIETMRDRYT